MIPNTWVPEAIDEPLTSVDELFYFNDQLAGLLTINSVYSPGMNSSIQPKCARTSLSRLFLKNSKNLQMTDSVVCPCSRQDTSD